MKSLCKLLDRVRNALPLWLVYTVSAVLAIMVSMLMLEYPTLIRNGWEAYLDPAKGKYLLLNLLSVGMLWCVCLILSNRVWVADLLLSSLSGIVAIINYYVTTLHGMPLSFLLLRNFKTAMNVISGYSITVDEYVIKLLIMIFAGGGLAAVTWWFTRGRQKKVPVSRVLIRDAALAVVCAIVFYLGYCGENPIKPTKTIGWHWSEAYSTYGYLPCTIETFFQSISGVAEPEGYTSQRVDSLEITDRSREDPATPDIILILNESYCDLRQLTDVETDVPVFEDIEGLDNLLMGYAISPSAGGGTNSSEYEILSSNSMWLLPGVTPFNTIDLVNASSIVSNLNTLGYYTLGSHCASGTNYSRVSGYRDLQFQNIHFYEDFTDVTQYEDRPYASDASVYTNLIRWYEEAPQDSPRFLYLLTIQNHGAYDRSDDRFDLVHVQNDWGDTVSLANEYLTQVQLSNQAFVGLTEYFSQVDRPVLVCMLGDHAPNFAGDLLEGESEAQKNLLNRKVPLLIWANYPLEQQDLGSMSMNYVVPTLLDIAGVRLSPYYSYLLQLKQQVPILTSYGDYYDAQGNRYTYDTDEGGPYADAVEDYFYLEYENLKKQRNQGLFAPYTD